MKINWKKVRLVCAWILFGLGCIPALALLIGVVVLGLLAIVCVSPGMLLAPNQSLNLTYKGDERNASISKGTWNWDKLNDRDDRGPEPF